MVAWELNKKSKSSTKRKHESDWNTEKLENSVTNDTVGKDINVVLIPAKILCFVQDQNGKMFAIIHSCLEHSVKMSVLTYRWQLEFVNDSACSNKNHPHKCTIDASLLKPIYWAVNVDTLQQQCLMIPYCNNSKSRFLMQVVDQDKWWQSFTYV